MTPRVRTTREGLAYGIYQRHEHPKPHMHVRGPGIRATLAIEDGALLEGKLSGRQLKEAQKWIEENRIQLLEMWHRRMEPGAVHEIIEDK